MHLSLVDFCMIVARLNKTNAEKAVAVLWYHDRKQPDVMMGAGQLAKLLVDHHVGNPNATALAEAITKTRLVNRSRNGFVLRPGSRKVVLAWLPTGIDGLQPEMDHSVGYLSDAVWIGTRGYIESVCRQLNGCFQACFYDAASVMLRRLMETLVIEAYEHLGRRGEIVDANDNPFMFGHLVERANGKQPHRGLNLGRDAKKSLEDVKALGDRSAHNRRFNAKASDLLSIQAGVRTASQELIQIANLQNRT
ncbi:MAG: hypothetical protein QM770_18590 [Tepidisphaeraceae bacterium]